MGKFNCKHMVCLRDVVSEVAEFILCFRSILRASLMQSSQKFMSDSATG